MGIVSSDQARALEGQRLQPLGRWPRGQRAQRTDWGGGDKHTAERSQQHQQEPQHSVALPDHHAVRSIWQHELGHADYTRQHELLNRWFVHIRNLRICPDLWTLIQLLPFLVLLFSFCSFGSANLRKDEPETRVPFRESKLTHLFKNHLQVLCCALLCCPVLSATYCTVQFRAWQLCGCSRFCSAALQQDLRGILACSRIFVTTESNSLQDSYIGHLYPFARSLASRMAQIHVYFVWFQVKWRRHASCYSSKLWTFRELFLWTHVID